MIKAYIISYLGQGDRAYTRYGQHQQQLNQLLRDERISHITILCQAYDVTCGESRRIEDLCPPHPRITYIHDEQMSPAQARNKLLKIFYEDKEVTWGHFADNDAIIDYRYDGTKVYDWFLEDTLPSAVKWVTCMSPRHQPWKGYLQQNEHTMKDCIPVHQCNYLKTTLFWVKHDTTHIYFDETMPEMEDMAMIGEVILGGMLMYQFKSVVM